MLGRGNSERKESAQQNGLLTIRLLNALPYSSSVKNIYNRTKNHNEVFRLGFNIAEACAGTVSSPFVKRYVALDRYAAAKWEQLENNSLIANTVGAIAYPFGYGLGLGKFARDKVVGVATPALEMTYEWADVVVDNLLPPDSDESLEEEYRRMSSLQQKSPFRRIKERVNVASVIRMPSNAFSFTMNLFSSTVYMSFGLLSMSLSRVIHNTTQLVDLINLHFEQHLDHPWQVNAGDVSKLYHVMVFHGSKSVNAFMAQLEHKMKELSEYLDDRKLPYNSKAALFVADKLKDIERRLVRIGGIQIEPAHITVIASTTTSTATTTTPRKVVHPRPRVLLSSAHKRTVSADERLPSMLMGEGEETVDQHKVELEEMRMPTMLWGASKNKYVHAKTHKDEPKKSTPKRAEEAKPAEEVEVEVEEPVVDPNADEYGYVPVRAKAHDHLIPAVVAKKLGQNLLRAPITPTNSPAEPLFNNPFSEISTDEDALVSGPAYVDNQHEALVKEKECKAHEHKLRKQALHQMMREVSRRLEKEESQEPANEEPKLEEPKLEEPKLEEPKLEEPKLEEPKLEEPKLEEPKLEEPKLEEPKLEEPKLEEGWEVPKHPAHIHVEEPAPEPNPDELPAPENNPFGKLAEEVNDGQDPLSMGLSSR